MPKATKPIAADLPFDEAMQKLEATVEAMESGDLPLETLLARFEEGTKLAQACQAKLAEAEVKIQRLEKMWRAKPRSRPWKQTGMNEPMSRYLDMVDEPAHVKN